MMLPAGMIRRASDGREIILAQVQSSVEQHSDVGAIIHHEQRAGAPAQFRDAAGIFEDTSREEAFVAELQNPRACFEQRLRRRDGVEIIG